MEYYFHGFIPEFMAELVENLSFVELKTFDPDEVIQEGNRFYLKRQVAQRATADVEVRLTLGDR